MAQDAEGDGEQSLASARDQSRIDQATHVSHGNVILMLDPEQQPLELQNESSIFGVTPYGSLKESGRNHLHISVIQVPTSHTQIQVVSTTAQHVDK